MILDSANGSNMASCWRSPRHPGHAAQLATGFSASVWRFIAPKTRRHRRAIKNLAKTMPEKTPAERKAIALGMWDNLGRVMAETFCRPPYKDPSLSSSKIRL